MDVFIIHYLPSENFESDAAYLGVCSTVEKAKVRCNKDSNFFEYGEITWTEAPKNSGHYEGRPTQGGGVYYIDKDILDKVCDD